MMNGALTGATHGLPNIVTGMQQKATIIMHVLAEAHMSMDPSTIFNAAKDITTAWPLLS